MSVVATKRSQVGEPEQGIATPVRSDRFPLFDSLRAIAALSVVVFHAGQAADALSDMPVDRWWEPVVARLPVGVIVFFLISGFLLYRPFAAARFERRRGPNLRSYARRRVLRIVPAYWVALFILFPLGLAWFPGGLWPDGLLIIGFGQLYSEETRHAGLGVSWSLSVEAAYYVLVPIYAAIAARFLSGRSTAAAVRIELAVLAVLAIASLAFSTAAYASGARGLAETLPGNFICFAFGMALAIVSAAGLGLQSRAVRIISDRPWVPWALSGGILVGAGTVAGLPELTDGLPETLTVGQFALEKVLYVLIALFLLLPAVFGGHRGGWPRRLLAAPAAAWIGLVSYGVYLWHSAIIQSLRGNPGGLLTLHPDLMFMAILVIAIPLAVLAGAISFYVVERPALRLNNGLPSLRRKSERVTTPEPLADASLSTMLGSPPAGASRSEHERTMTVAVNGGPSAPRAAREQIADFFKGDMEPDVLDDVKLLVSEVLANSFRHGGVDEDGHINLTVRLDDRRARVDVWDTGRQGVPQMRKPDFVNGEGFGLYLVSRISSQWGTQHDPALRVWFEVPNTAALTSCA